ncbi:MAG: 3'(2'),5'-bisphosphate nucleotidase CysQ [Actinomycetota bacterium]
MTPSEPGRSPLTDLAALDDHRLAAALATEAGHALVALRNRAVLTDWSPWELGDRGDLEAHRLLMDRLAEARPDDAVLSEEGRDTRDRLSAERTWIVDPLDGSNDYSSGHSPDYAVHVALVRNGTPVAGAVSLPDTDEVFATDDEPAEDPGRTAPVVIASRAQARWGMAIAETLGGSALIAGSAGVKAMAVVRGEADVYIHPSGLYEWDACAPEAVAVAAGLEVCDLEQGPIRYNKDYPVVRGFLVARPRFVEPVLDLLR